MDKKLLWLGLYIRKKANFKLIQYFINNIELSEIFEKEKISKKEIVKLAQEELKNAERQNIQILFYEDKKFPPQLKDISYPPLFLYVKGEFNCQMPLFSIVGSRKPTIYGKEVAYEFAKKIAENGIGIVSGLARGIDSIAHKGCLDVNGYTIGVLGSGLDIIYPPENRDLFERIIKNKGAIISEFPLGTKPRKENFPRRNRIISGLGTGVLVIEAGKKSGTLITAKWALEQGKEVFAVPGNIFSSQSEGTHYLLKQGAILVTSPEDIFYHLGLESQNIQKEKKLDIELSEEEKEILNFISSYPQHIEEIIAKSRLPAFKILSILTDLEIKGLIENLPGKYVKLKRNF